MTPPRAVKRRESWRVTTTGRGPDRNCAWRLPGRAAWRNWGGTAPTGSSRSASFPAPGVLRRGVGARRGPGRDRGAARLRPAAADRLHRDRLRIPLQPTRGLHTEIGRGGSLLVRPPFARPPPAGGRAGGAVPRRAGGPLSIRPRPPAAGGARAARHLLPAPGAVRRPLRPGGVVLPLEAGAAHSRCRLGHVPGGTRLPARGAPPAVQGGGSDEVERARAKEETEAEIDFACGLVPTCLRRGVPYPFAAAKERLQASFLTHPEDQPFSPEQQAYVAADAEAAARLYPIQVQAALRRTP